MWRRAPSPVHAAAASAAASFFLFIAAWIATFLAAGRFIPHQWAALLSVVVATLAANQILDAGHWRIGFFVPPARAAREIVLGIGLAALLIGACDLALMFAAHLRHTRNDGLPWLELVTVFVPAAFHEELAFRGYLFQKLRRWNRAVAFAFSAFVFAALHFANNSITALALMNIALAGILLALAYERYERLWFPIGIHLTWNILSGPLLGYPVSGYMSHTTVLATTARGADWITGGRFGIEGSAFIATVEVAAIAWLAWSPATSSGGKSAAAESP